MKPAQYRCANRFAPGLVVSGLAVAGAMCWAIGLAGRSPTDGGREPATGNREELFSGAIVKLGLDIEPREIKSLRSYPRKYVHTRILEGFANYPEAYARLKGSIGSFRPVDDKPGFTISFTRHGATRLFHGLSQIHLNNSVEDPSFLNEQLGSEMFREAGIPAPRVTRALVELNGRPLGLYTLVEGYTEDFLASAFSRGDGTLYDPEIGRDVDSAMKRSGGRGDLEEDDLEALAAACATRNPRDRWAKLQQTLDVDRFASFMAMEVMLGHQDGYCMARNNYRVYHDPKSDKLVFLPHGMDELFAKPDLTWKPMLGGTVARAVMETPEGRDLYDRRFRELFDKVFQLAKWNKRVDQILAEAQPGLAGGEFRELSAQAVAVKGRLARRRMSLEAQLARPEQTFTRFNNGKACLTDWSVCDSPEDGELAKAESPDGAPSLKIVAKGSIAASWRTRALLKRGSYRFEGRVRVAGVEPLKSTRRGGATLRVSGESRAKEELAGDTSWRRLEAPFAVKDEAKEVELDCELDASAGSAWFDLHSLRLVEAP